MAITVRDALQQLDDRRVKVTRPLIPPAILQEDLPLYVAYHYMKTVSHGVSGL